jgi:hypothetical protein
MAIAEDNLSALEVKVTDFNRSEHLAVVVSLLIGQKCENSRTVSVETPERWHWQ